MPFFHSMLYLLSTLYIPTLYTSEKESLWKTEAPNYAKHKPIRQKTGATCYSHNQRIHTRKDILEHENGNHYNVGHDQILNNLKKCHISRRK